MSRPWMPLYVADYLRDTRKLTAAEHGAYLLLIMEYWTTGSLPDDDKQLSRIVCMSAAEWKKAKPNVQGYFLEGWMGHKRIDAELAKSADISSKRSASAKLKHSKTHANAEQEHTHAGATSQPQSQLQTTQERKDAASAALVPTAEADYYRRVKEVIGPSGGGVGKKLLDSKGGSVPLARAAVEQASTKQDPREYLGAIIRNRGSPDDEASRVGRSF